MELNLALGDFVKHLHMDFNFKSDGLLDSGIVEFLLFLVIVSTETKFYDTIV